MLNFTSKEIRNFLLSLILTIFASIGGYLKIEQVEEEALRKIEQIQQDCYLREERYLQQIDDCFSELELALLTHTNYENLLSLEELDSILIEIEWKRKYIRDSIR